MANKLDKEENPKDSDVLQIALNQLRMDQESWSTRQQNQDLATCATEDLSSGKVRVQREADECSQEGPQNTEKTHLKSPSRQIRDRKQPYSKDYLQFSDKNIPSIETLTFAEEMCKNKNCTCNQKKETDSFSKSDKYSLNFAQACKFQTTTQKKTLQEPHLKLHNKQKDQRVIIRAARLKLAKQFKPSSFTNSPVPKPGGIIPVTVFGSTSKETPQYPSILKSEGRDTETKKNANKFRGISFGSYRQNESTTTSMQNQGATYASSDKFNLSALDEGLPTTSKLSGNENVAKTSSLRGAGKKRSPSSGNHCPLHPGKCSRPCSCSQQALMDPVDDWTVNELACYFDDYVHIPKKMSLMAEMMYT